MARPELGTKRQCAGCDAKFYDLDKDPIICPKCGTQFLLAVEAVKPDPKPAAVAKPAEKPEAAEEDDEEDVEIVSLEDVEEEDSEDIPEIEDVEIDDDESEGEEDAFLEDDDEEGNDVSGLIGGGLSEKEDDT